MVLKRFSKVLCQRLSSLVVAHQNQLLEAEAELVSENWCQ